MIRCVSNADARSWLAVPVHGVWSAGQALSCEGRELALKQCRPLDAAVRLRAI